MKPALSKRWRWFLLFAFALGAVLRLVHVEDMEYKEDEEYNFLKTQGSDAWPWIGMPSGVYIPNPGMSVWIFTLLARISRATTPTGLATAVQLCSLVGIALLLVFAIRFVSDREREPWLWATAIALVNPFQILYSRKLWPEPCLLPFCILTLMGYWRRDKSLGALTWGFFGLVLGQIHMSGYFLAAGFFFWTYLTDRKSAHWRGYFAGSALAALPLLPWIGFILTHPAGGRVSTGWTEVVQFKYFVFWLTDPLGLHLGNPLGLLLGDGLAQLRDFNRYPLWNGMPTYFIAAAHGVLALTAALILFRTGATLVASVRKGFRRPKLTPTHRALLGACLATGLLLTITGVNIRRYYLVVTFPLEFVTLALLALRLRLGRRLLALIWVAELIVSAGFVDYIHVNGGAVQGDYGPAYHLVKKSPTPAAPLAP